MQLVPPLLFRRLVIALAIPAIGYSLFATGEQAIESRHAANQAADLRRQVDALMAENVRLQNELNYRRSDAYVERLAREQLGLVMPGDHAVDLVGDNLPPRSRPATDEVPPATTTPPLPAREPPLDAWVAYFFRDR